MRLILESHPEVVCYDELKSYAVLQGTMAQEARGARLVGFKIPRWTEQLDCPVLLDEGPEGPCDRFYHGEAILFLLRDAKDTLASMLKLKAGESNWCEIWVPRIIEGKLAHHAGFLERYAADLALAAKCQNKLLALAALYWKYKVDSFFSYREKAYPVLPVHYAELVANPKPKLISVCEHLGIPFNEDLLRHHELTHTELFENGLTLGNTDPAKPIHLDSVGQWTRFLDPADLEIVEQICGSLSARVAGLSSSGE
jgi:Sulfotransferase domain